MSATTSRQRTSTEQHAEGRKMNSKQGIGSRVRSHLAVAAAALTAVGLLAGAPAASAIELEKAQMAYTQPESTSPLRQAGAYPDVTTIFAQKPVATEPFTALSELMHRFEIDLPPGLLANAAKFPTCSLAAMKAGPNGNNAVCPINAQMGTIEVPGAFPLGLPLYNIEPPKGSPAMFGANVLGNLVLLRPFVRPGDYGITFDSGEIPQGILIREVIVKFWGIPADPIHDPRRVEYQGGAIKFNKPSTAPRQPLTLSPTSCTSEAATAEARLDGWQSIGLFERLLITHDIAGEEVKFTGCDQLGFTPTVEAKPSTTVADSPAGLDVSIKMPQNEDPDGYAEAHLRDVTMKLPAGMAVNPSSASGLSACSPAEIGLSTAVGQTPAIFNGEPARCPDASKLGTVVVKTALLANPMPGEVYLAQQAQNPFGSLLALYIVIDDPQSGIRIKLAGEASPDPNTGQLTVTFPNNPQLPFEEFNVSLFTGPRAALKTPTVCGTHTTNSTLTPWSSPAGSDVQSTNSYTIDKSPSGACVNTEAAAPNTPTFDAGTLDPTAGAYSQFALKIARADATQPINRIRATLPKGLLGKLAGIPYCSDAALTLAAAKPGRAEQAAPSCSPASQVGTVDVGAGAGSTPFHAAGVAYLAGPYKGAPLSLAVVTPAVAGPFDLGTVVIRNALNVDPESTQISAVSDVIPSILKGIPLDIRTIDLSLDRSRFTLNPTSCDPMEILGAATSVFNQEAGLKDPFQVGGCGVLAFKPKLGLKLKGATKRGKYPALTAVLDAGAGEANIARASVGLPHSVFLAQNHIRTVCTRVQFAAEACPAGAVYGQATAFSPLLDQPLSGPVYLRSSANKLPDLVADLRGQIRVALVGRIDSFKGGIRTTFESVPDAPVSKFVLRMQGGKKGLLVNSRDICRSVTRADVQFDGQNGKAGDSTPVLANSCKKQPRKAKHSRQR
jgi:hypothetical protein